MPLVLWLGVYMISNMQAMQHLMIFMYIINLTLFVYIHNPRNFIYGWQETFCIKIIRLKFQMSNKEESIINYTCTKY